MAFTYFFRDISTLDMIIENVLPALKTRQYINIWDAGCAMGPEPYSLAIMLRENMSGFMFRNVRILATDIDESDFGKTISEGIYPHEQVQRIPEEIFKKYFKPAGAPNMYIISEEIRKSVDFHRNDLLELKPIRSGFGLIMCKNVLLHFNEAQRVQVLRMFHETLNDDGYFAMEQTQKMPDECLHLFEPVANTVQLFRKIC